MPGPTITLASVTLDCPDPEQLADFYSALLGWAKNRISDEWLAVSPPDGPFYLLFQESADYIPPVWPYEEGKQQQMTHLDFSAPPSEKDAAVRHALACGATLSPVQHSPEYTIFLDPVGHPFCIGFFD
jgi:catechol 2,3-dioxygenase-like lactoylglutathione lyase family enzyme